MVGFGRRKDGPGGRRSAGRKPAFKAAAILTLGRSQIGYLLDVSATGARLDGGGDLSIGQDILLRVGAVETLAQVVWSGPDQCGIRFDVPLSDEELEPLTRVPQGALFARLSPEEKLGAEDWQNGLVH